MIPETPLSSEYDRFENFYYEFIKNGLTKEDSAFNQNTTEILRLLGNVKGRRICDLACGEGFLSRALAERKAVVTGIDVSENLLAHARRQSGDLPINYLRDDAQSLATVRDASFEAVICNMALMDIPDLEATFRTANRILRPDGLFIFVVLHPCFESPFNVHNSPIVKDEDGNFVALQITRYGEEGKWYSGGTGMRGTLGSIHRMLSTYLNALIAAGFMISDVVEPLRASNCSSHSTKPEQAHIIPLVLVVKAGKRT